MRAALLAMAVWKLMIDSSTVSTSCASSRLPVTRSTGSPGKKTVPSRIAQTLPRNRKSASASKKPSPTSRNGLSVRR